MYLFIAVAGLGIGATAYFGLTFTPIESALAALVALSLLLLVLERTLRNRAEKRLEAAIDDLTRLAGAGTQANEILGQRVNTLYDQDAGNRLDVVEADVSVLGTVVRQVAEAVADLEAERNRARTVEERAPAEPVARPAAATEPEPVIPLEMLKQAIADGRLVFHARRIVTLPQRRVFGHDLVPRLQMEDGELADPPDFMPRRSGEPVIRRIERMACDEAVAQVRRARTQGNAQRLFVPLSRATLSDQVSVDQIVAVLDANRAINDHIAFVLPQRDWVAMADKEQAAVSAMVKKGASFSIADLASLRLDFADLSARGVTSVRVDARRFVEEPETLTDFHSSDIAAYARRFEIELMATGVSSEQQVLSLIEDGVGVATGPQFADLAPLQSDGESADTASRELARRARN